MDTSNTLLYAICSLSSVVIRFGSYVFLRWVSLGKGLWT